MAVNFILCKGKQSTVLDMSYSVLPETTVTGENTRQNLGSAGLRVNKTSAETATRVMTLKEFPSLAHFEPLEYI